MSDETIEDLKTYEELMLKKRAIDNELEALKAEIVPKLPVEIPVETDIGIFTIESKPKWIYSKDTRDLEDTLKEVKEREKQDGTAVAEPGNPYLVYREKKGV